MTFTRRLMPRVLFLLVSLTVACSGPVTSSGDRAVIPAQDAALHPHLPYVFVYLNYTRSTIHLKSFGSQCMSRIPPEMSIRPQRTADVRITTSAGGRCLTRQSVYYTTYTGAPGGKFDIQFTKKVHSAWVARNSGPRNTLVRFCWYPDGLGGTAVIVNGTRCIV